MKTKYDHTFGKKYFWGGAKTFSLAFALFLVAAATALIWTVTAVVIVVVIAILGLFVFAIGIVREQQAMAGYICKNCGRILKSETEYPSRKIVFPCTHCEVRWEVNLYKPD